MQNKKRIAVVPGDGIGKEVIPQAVSVIGATGAPVEFTEFDWGADRYLKDGTTIPADGFQMLARDFDAIFVGALGDPRVPTNIHAKEILLGMRFKMDLYANVRPVKLLDESLCPLKNAKPEDVDFVVIRENTEGVYMDMGGLFKAGTPDEVATQEDINTRKGVERVIRFAFEYAKTNGRKKVLMSDKSNVMTYAGGLWQRVFKEVAKEYPEIQTQHMFVDALCLQMVQGSEVAGCDRDEQYVWRHRDGPGGRAAGRAGHGGEREYTSGKDVDVRAGAWIGAADCREECGESDGRDSDGSDDAGASGICGWRRRRSRARCWRLCVRRRRRSMWAERWGRGNARSGSGSE